MIELLAPYSLYFLELILLNNINCLADFSAGNPHWSINSINRLINQLTHIKIPSIWKLWFKKSYNCPLCSSLTMKGLTDKISMKDDESNVFLFISFVSSSIIFSVSGLSSNSSAAASLPENQSINQSIKHPPTQSTTQPTNQPINQSIC